MKNIILLFIIIWTFIFIFWEHQRGTQIWSHNLTRGSSQVTHISSTFFSILILIFPCLEIHGLRLFGKSFERASIKSKWAATWPACWSRPPRLLRVRRARRALINNKPLSRNYWKKITKAARLHVFLISIHLRVERSPLETRNERGKCWRNNAKTTAAQAEYWSILVN